MSHERMNWELDEERYLAWATQQPGYWMDEGIKFIFIVTGATLISAALYGIYWVIKTCA